MVWMIHTISTSQSSALVLMGWDSEGTSISDQVHNGSCRVGCLDDTHILHLSEFHTGPHGVGFRRHMYFKLGPQWFMWGGSLYDTHILHQSQFHTGPQGVGFRRHIYILEFVHNGSCGVGGCMMTFYSIGGHRGFEVWWGMYVPEGAHYTHQTNLTNLA